MELPVRFGASPPRGNEAGTEQCNCCTTGRWGWAKLVAASLLSAQPGGEFGPSRDLPLWHVLQSGLWAACRRLLGLQRIGQAMRVRGEGFAGRGFGLRIGHLGQTRCGGAGGYCAGRRRRRFSDHVRGVVGAGSAVSSHRAGFLVSALSLFAVIADRPSLCGVRSG